jgi:hypothetical protein
MTFMMRPSVRRRPARRSAGRCRCTGLAADEAFGRVHGDGAHGVFAEVLGDFEDEAVAVVVGLQRVQDLRQVAVELHVDDGADDLGNVADMLRPAFSSFVDRASP